MPRVSGNLCPIRYHWRMDVQARPASLLETLFANFDPADYPVIARSNQGLIVRVRENGLDLAVKTPTGHGPARWLHSYALRREYKAYCQLEGLPGLPVCHGLFRRRYLALQYIEARTLRDSRPADPEHFFARLLEIIRAMHERGIAHCDLKRKHNILIAPGDEPCVIDLGSTLVRRPGRWRISQRLFDYMCRIDYNAWVKLKYGGYEGVADHDRHLLNRTRIERAITRWRRR